MTRFYYKQNRLKQLRAFCHVAQVGSMSKAADQMSLSQPSISLLVQALEKDMGSTLFLRQGPRIQLTAEGKILLELALPLVEGLEILPDAFHERCHNHISGELNIAAGESTILYILPGILKQFAINHPGIRVKLSNVTGHDGLELLRGGKVDFAVGSMLEIPEDIHYTPIFTYETVLITAHEHPLAAKKNLTLEDIGQYGLILPPRHLSTWRIVDLVFQQHNVKYNVILEAGGWEVIKKYVQMNMGVSIVTSICLSDREELVSIPLSQYFPKRTYGLVLRRGKYMSPAARKFIELIAPHTLEQYRKTGIHSLTETTLSPATGFVA
ncbi:MAG: LysR family transcriptional regulator [Gammaproteobacteria bacterium RBG_16_51_14]|nr:MAG: LysR family transcriptional regulator [Gammaproteobacteria bacterium RBG_16_51_14]